MCIPLTQLIVVGCILTSIHSASALVPTLVPTSCDESPTDEFFYKINKAGIEKFHDCAWLKKRGSASRDKICSFERDPARPTYEVAKEVCRNTCICQIYAPTAKPTDAPTYIPSTVPSDLPSHVPSAPTSDAPSASPIETPTSIPS
eukprot:CAMPEP_0194072972 /NCGR_PEP_ID=MMETSP0149-20130528/559_1 /TAXON_ID=122233 /ORGANISM="Chaetoceros debilis, Strain MM31A-1" /LENGTH=145 /DNA_ID=CAMNT_0038752921 /DNA_START=119 /DNA_END=553 /DNA_ORIENTATION=+